ncbi:hypothetical protein HXX76_015202 [Chlamydomonas incerta]|uniref:RAP domain-containing protein n=1 Tax=Chlamydomonas incerta TaxID=51695 RepID=A0A835SA72_CHLIN|nr:hypothetical protein HXX76_015202 [Chlamydomonas incerta]|eukprot:KAG2423562.1 hypothetical protein HXX76_015202 [Chlamydomonas incerta]
MLPGLLGARRPPPQQRPHPQKQLLLLPPPQQLQQTGTALEPAGGGDAAGSLTGSAPAYTSTREPEPGLEPEGGSEQQHQAHPQLQQPPTLERHPHPPPTLEALHAAVRECGAAWVAQADVTTMTAAFFLAGKAPSLAASQQEEAEEGEGGRPSPLRVRVLCDLAEAYLPLVPHIRLPGEVSTPLAALARLGPCGSSRSSSRSSSSSSGSSRGPWAKAQQLQLAVALMRLLVGRPALVERATAAELSEILFAVRATEMGRQRARKALVRAIAAQLARRGFEGFSPHAFSTLVLALAQKDAHTIVHELVNPQQQQWIESAATAAMPRGWGGADAMAGATAQDWANLLYALALVRHQPPLALLDDAGAASALQQGSGQDCADLLWALAVLQLRHGGVEAAVCGRLGALLEHCPQRVATQALANSLWALAALSSGDSGADAGAGPLAAALACEAVGRWRDFQPRQLRMLWKAQQALPDVVAAAVLGAYAHLQAKPQKQVEAALRRLQRQGRLPITSLRMEAAEERAFARVDIVVEWGNGPQERAAVEFDGPVHFLTNRRGDPAAVDGPTALCNAQLRRVFGEARRVCVPFWEWAALRGDAQEAYLLQRLQPLMPSAPAVSLTPAVPAPLTPSEPAPAVSLVPAVPAPLTPAVMPAVSHVAPIHASSCCPQPQPAEPQPAEQAAAGADGSSASGTGSQGLQHQPVQAADAAPGSNRSAPRRAARDQLQAQQQAQQEAAASTASKAATDTAAGAAGTAAGSGQPQTLGEEPIAEPGAATTNAGASGGAVAAAVVAAEPQQGLDSPGADVGATDAAGAPPTSRGGNRRARREAALLAQQQQAQEQSAAAGPVQPQAATDDMAEALLAAARHCVQAAVDAAVAQLTCMGAAGQRPSQPRPSQPPRGSPRSPVLTIKRQLEANRILEEEVEVEVRLHEGMVMKVRVEVARAKAKAGAAATATVAAAGADGSKKRRLAG